MHLETNKSKSVSGSKCVRQIQQSQSGSQLQEKVDSVPEHDRHGETSSAFHPDDAKESQVNSPHPSLHMFEALSVEIKHHANRREHRSRFDDFMEHEIVPLEFYQHAGQRKVGAIF